LYSAKIKTLRENLLLVKGVLAQKMYRGQLEMLVTGVTEICPEDNVACLNRPDLLADGFGLGRILFNQTLLLFSELLFCSQDS